VRKRIALLRSGNRVVVDPTTDRVRGMVEPELTYVEKIVYRGREKYERKKAGLPTVVEQLWAIHGDDHKGRLAFPRGFLERVVALLEADGYPVDVRWATSRLAEGAAARANGVYRPRWDRVEELLAGGFKFRYRQRRALELIAEHECGRIDCHPGWGKGTLIMLACMLYPRARIAVVTDRVAVLHQRLYPELAMNLPNVGIVGGGKKIKGRRVMCYTADSLHHATGEEDFLFVDEGHEACADKFAASLAGFDRARVWMFSSTWDMRLDGKDLRGEAIAGPIRLKVPYSKGVEHDLVVPIEVLWDDCVMDINPCADLEDVDKKRYGIWSNEVRNAGFVRRNARLYDDDTQVLITVETLEHGLYLKQLLPEFELVYAPETQKPKDWNWFDKQGLLGENFRVLTPERRQRLTRRFERGRLKKVIATPVWNVGVDFRHLQVLIRADAGGSPINDTQIPGRNARHHVVEGRKAVGIVHDCQDQFDTGFHQKAKGREKSYTKNEWTQHHPGKQKKSLLRRLMGWGPKR
jgi:superfamily II DNA or RNA helicase